MQGRRPDPWQTNARAPFLTMERAQGVIEVWALGSDRFTVNAPDHEQIVVGLDAARQTAHELAYQLD
jgi:hypothetical protein